MDCTEENVRARVALGNTYSSPRGRGTSFRPDDATMLAVDPAMWQRLRAPPPGRNPTDASRALQGEAAAVPRHRGMGEVILYVFIHL